MTRTPAATSTSGTIALTKGTRITPDAAARRRAAERADGQDVLAVVQDVVDGADDGAVGGADGKANQVVSRNSSGSSGGASVAGIDGQPGAAKLGRGVPVA